LLKQNASSESLKAQIDSFNANVDRINNELETKSITKNDIFQKKNSHQLENEEKSYEEIKKIEKRD